ncbi:DinB family protein [Paenibacillus sp. BSR1-1]|uniref:DinB family protein n=1 Tax=Paenibacillus sp. BSR1-1 TaxID=3020845 RepID=UPI0025AFAC6E|nr:DinB family protein [Paenibacillus sp. BSR1-1]MDN3017318.1 DinB family protein [Paenibacillus sp. BSR1-1]
MNQIIFGNLGETRKQLLDEITTLSFEELNTVLRSDAWSVAQVCHHLYLAEKSFVHGINYALKQKDSPKVEPNLIDRISDRTKKVDAPSFVIPSEEPFEIHHILNMLKESRTMLLNVLNKIENDSILRDKSAKHPLFGELPLIQWIELIYLHEQRHIEQINEIKSQIL